MNLWDHQQEAIEAILAHYYEGVKRQLIVLPTGSGKTASFSTLPAVAGMFPTLVLNDRTEIAIQNLKALRERNPGRKVTLEKAKDYAAFDSDIVLASVPTLGRGEGTPRLKTWPEDHFKLIIVDEAHHCSGTPTYAKILRHFKPELLTGWTATPARADGIPLARIFDKIVYERTVVWAIEQGYLCRVRARTIRTKVDISNLHTRAGDFAESELSKAVNTDWRNSMIISAVENHAADRRSILVFCVDKAHAMAMTRQFQKRGHDAEYVLDRDPPEAVRRERIRRFREGTLRVLINVGVATEGFDAPICDCLVLARPTKSLTLFTQCLDQRTEILTRRGWVGSDSISPTDLVATYDRTTAEVGWNDILNIVRRPLGGEKVVEYKSRCLDFRVTAGHRLLIKSRATGRRGGGFAFARADDAAALRDGISLPSAGVEQVGGAALTDDEIRFIGWYLTDGAMNKKTGVLQFSQSEHKYAEELDRVITACGFKCGRGVDNKPTNFGPRRSPLRLFWVSKNPRPRRDKTGNEYRPWTVLSDYINPERTLTPAFEDLDRRQLGVLLHAMHLGDGAGQLRPYYSKGKEWTRRSYSIGKGNRLLCDQLQSLCVRRGFECTLSATPAGKNNRKRPFYILHIKDRATRFIGGQGQGDRPSMGISVGDPGEIFWCVETSAGTIITRRNGKVAIMGNCIGRVLRSHPGKADGLVLDCVDTAGRHGVVTASELFGERDIDALGGDLLDAVKKKRQLAEELGLTFEDDGEGITPEQMERERVLAEKLAMGTVYIETEAEAVELFRHVKLDPQVAKDSQFKWIKIHDSRYVLRTDEECDKNKPGSGYANLTRDDLGNWKLALKGYESPLGSHQTAPFPHADRIIKRLVADWRMRQRNAKWNLDPPTEAQLDQLRRMGVSAVPQSPTSKWDPQRDFTKGSVSEMIDHLKAMRKLKRGQL